MQKSKNVFIEIKKYNLLCRQTENLEKQNCTVIIQTEFVTRTTQRIAYLRSKNEHANYPRYF